MEVKKLLNGCFINADKPDGPTSHDVDLMVRKMLGVDKTGHFGTLDPMVTGVLPVAVGKATRLLQYLESGKEYAGVMNLHEEIPKKRVQEMIKKEFTGRILQTPPVKSRVKRVERPREIYSFKILESQGRDFLFYVKCEAGTYIRKICHDLGEKLGVGAHMTELRRTRAGMFKEKDIVSMNDFARAVEEFKKGNEGPLGKMLIPMEEIVRESLRMIEVKKDILKRIGNGGPIFPTDIPNFKKLKLKEGEKIALMCDGKLVSVAKVINEDKVLMKQDTVFMS